MAKEHQHKQVFEVRIEGSIPDEALADLGDIDVVLRELRTSVRARIRDQSELHGFLAQLRAHGLEVVEVRRVVTAEGTTKGDPS